jgi:hypothetical protein
MVPGRDGVLRRAAIGAILVGVLAAGCMTGHPAHPTPSRAATSSTVRPADGSPGSTAASAAASDPGSASAPPPVSPAPAVAPTTPATPTPGPATQPTDATAAGFTATAAAVTAAELGKSWHAGCPVGPSQLRTVTLTYWGFDGVPHLGAIVVAASAVPSVIRVFHILFGEHFPIRSMQPTAVFGGSDDASMAVDNTSAFNCRYAVATGTPRWSAHAYGKAIDVNTVENPYSLSGKVLPPIGAPYLERTPYRPGMAVPGGQLVRAFAAIGWQWGGRWTSSPDYQHFSADGG